MVRLAKPIVSLLVPVAAWWVAREERKILGLGTPLSEAQLADAARMGVAHPEKIRVLHVARLPLFNGPLARALARVVPGISPDAVAVTLGYGIYVRDRFAGDRALLAHECVHTGQYERHGGIRGFLRAYFTECLAVGYPNGPLEREANERAATLCAGGGK